MSRNYSMGILLLPKQQKKEWHALRRLRKWDRVVLFSDGKGGRRSYGTVIKAKKHRTLVRFPLGLDDPHKEGKQEGDEVKGWFDFGWCSYFVYGLAPITKLIELASDRHLYPEDKLEFEKATGRTLEEAIAERNKTIRMQGALPYR